MLDINEMKMFIETEFLGEAVVISPSMIKRSPRGKNFIAVDSEGMLVADDLTDKAFKSGDLVNYDLVADGQSEIEIQGSVEPVIARLVHKLGEDGKPVYVEGTEPDEVPETEEDYFVVTKKTGKMVRANTGRKSTWEERNKTTSVKATDKKTLTPSQKAIVDAKDKKEVEKEDKKVAKVKKLDAQKVKELRFEVLNAIRGRVFNAQFLEDFYIVNDNERKNGFGIVADMIFAYESPKGDIKFIVKNVNRAGKTKADWSYAKRDIKLDDVQVLEEQ